jgi:hypothetical protein
MRAHVIGLMLFGVVSAACAANANRVSYQGKAHHLEVPQPKYKYAVSGTKIPWQLTPASTASRAQGERTSVRYIRKFGRVRGTKVALANISKPMVPYPGPRGVVQPCRNVIQPQAIHIGAYSVEAAAAGPERRLHNDVRRQQVFFRIFYRHKGSIEVRQAALICTLNANGKIVAASPT